MQNRKIREWGGVSLKALEQHRHFEVDEIWRLHFPIQEVLGRLAWTELKPRTASILKKKAACSFASPEGGKHTYETLAELIEFFCGPEQHVKNPDVLDSPRKPRASRAISNIKMDKVKYFKYQNEI